jgi:ethanolamine utilization protein EutN
VVGTVVATQKRPQFEGAKLLLVQPETPQGEAKGATLLAIDSVGAGVSERVLVVLEGRAAGEALGKKTAPVDAAIIGIVDQLDSWNERRRTAIVDSAAIQKHMMSVRSRTPAEPDARSRRPEPRVDQLRSISLLERAPATRCADRAGGAMQSLRFLQDATDI